MSPPRKIVNRLRAVLAALFICLIFGSAHAQEQVTHQYFYDEQGQLIRVVDSTGVSIEYVYDKTGNLIEVKRTVLSNAGALSILNFTPQQGGPGTKVTIQGQGFSTTPAQDVVKFNGVAAAVTSA
ncbi:MAG: IPT/TIG domain-containing protein, partial [Acidobacteriota bacterium]|nr:IPT/TIG domain-containing protein [Acidobacteriota bacterium]